MATIAKAQQQKPVPAPAMHTNAGRAFLARQTDWLQDTRLMAEAIFRLRGLRRKGKFDKFFPGSWPRKNTVPFTSTFSMGSAEIDDHIEKLLFVLLESRFVFLETLWETYLSELVVELSHTSGSFFEDALKESGIASDLVRNALTDKYKSINDMQLDIGVLFAERTTRASFLEQWKKLAKLVRGLPADSPKDQWFSDLEVYFCMRNCVIHREAKVSIELAARSPFFEKQVGNQFRVYPGHLDYYRHSFIGCVSFIESKLAAHFAATAGKTSADPTGGSAG